MQMRGRIRVRAAITLFIMALLLVVPTASADQMTSTNFKLNGNVNSSFGGQSGSTSYGMFSTGGEAIIGAGAGGSYMMGQGFVAQSEQAIQLAVQPSGLQGFYRGDEGTGKFAGDSSAYGRGGELKNNAGWTASGKIGGAFTTGSNVSDHIEIPTNPVASGDKLTVSMWAKQTSAHANDALASTWKADGDAEGWALQIDGSDTTKLKLYMAASSGDTGSNYVDTTSGAWSPNNSWHHVAFTYDGSLSNSARVKIYVDGAAVGTTVTGTLPTALVDNNTSLVLANFLGMNRAFTGSLDHVKLFNRVLAPDEIKAEFSAQNASNETGLSLGVVTAGASNTALYDVIVRTDSPSYSVAAVQNNNLQKGGQSIVGVSGSIASPGVWTEGTTKGLGFTLLSAPGLDVKWGAGANYAAFPASATTFYSRSGHDSVDTIDVISGRLRLDVSTSQESGDYTNTITYTGTILP